MSLHSSRPYATNLHDIPLETLHDLLQPITVPSTSPKASFTNWGLSYTCRPLMVFEPETEYQCDLILELARREGQTVRAAGVGHSPSDLACTSGYMLRTDRLRAILEINTEKRYITAQGGAILSDLHVALAQHDLAMINVGSISDQTIAGLVATATHGTGMNFTVISNQVISLVVLLADGTRVRCSRQERSDLFMASLCGLGSTGLIMQIQLQVGPAFRLKDSQETLSFDHVVDQLDSIARSAEHVRMWWFPQADVVRVSSADRTKEERKLIGTWLWHSLLGFHFIQFLLFLGIYFPSLNPWISRLTVQMDRDPTETVDDSWRVFNLDCKYPQYTVEWSIPYQQTQACLRELRRWLDDEHADPNGLRPHFPIEVRFTEADEIWLSPSYGQRSTWIGIIQYKPYGLNVPYRKLFERFENILVRHGGRPHWAKSHRLRPDGLRALYPRFDDFTRVLNDVDPNGLFRNEYVQRHVFGKEGPQYHERIFKALQ